MKVQYVAFLRAINTGNRRIKMAGLRALYGDLGYSNVATYLATGNVIFDAPSPPLPLELEVPFAQQFGFTSEVFLRSGEEIRSILDTVPWRGDDVVVEVSFLEREPGVAEARSLEATAVAPEELAVSGREVFFLRGHGRGAPTTHKESTSLDLLNMKMTRRGMATVVQVYARFLLPRM
ncbi:MAG: DUF1697 domain-containing protein [Actinomycetia bacterium]|nr:DUF1697 domain-containing protein [Actinomycetes bacterium]